MKEELKANVAKSTTIPREAVDGADYIFDEWLNALALQPITAIEAQQWRTLPVLKASKAELAALHALDEGVVVDEKVRKQLRAVQTVVVPQLLKQE